MAASNHFPDVVIGINPDAFDAMRMGLRTALLDSGLFIEQKQPAPEPPTRFERFTNWLWRASYNLIHYPGLIVRLERVAASLEALLTRLEKLALDSGGGNVVS